MLSSFFRTRLIALASFTLHLYPLIYTVRIKDSTTATKMRKMAF